PAHCSCLLASFVLSLLRPPSSPLFPYTTLFRSLHVARARCGRDRRAQACWDHLARFDRAARSYRTPSCSSSRSPGEPPPARPSTDRKSTRLNSSHQIISYAVFCLKKKKPTSLAC